jgi:hypothetical protein
MLGILACALNVKEKHAYVCTDMNMHENWTLHVTESSVRKWITQITC